MVTVRKRHLIAAVMLQCCLLLFGWASARALPEKLSPGQKAPDFAESSAGRSLALPRPEEPEGPGLQGLLSRLGLKTSGQTPADTSLLPREPQQQSRRSGQQNLLELLHIKASGQTPADTSLLPRPEETPVAAAVSGHQSRRAGQGSAAHVTLVNSQSSVAASSGVSRAGQTPANVGLLQGGRPRPQPAATQQEQEEGVQRQETSSFKEVNGETVRVVVGNYGYDSPEGLPVSFKYMSDENGNQASFTIGAAGGGGGTGGSRPGGASGGSKAGAGGGSGGAGRGSGAAAGKGGAGGAKGGAGDADRKYLPPK